MFIISGLGLVFIGCVLPFWVAESRGGVYDGDGWGFSLILFLLGALFISLQEWNRNEERDDKKEE